MDNNNNITDRLLTNILETAIRIEEEGREFYEALEAKSDKKELKKLFKSLAKDEVKHKKTFENMLKNIKPGIPAKMEEAKNLTDEYISLLGSYTKADIFTSERVKKASERLLTLKDSILFAIKRELDSILYYQEVKEFLAPESQEVVNDIIREERNHFLKLSALNR